MLRPSTRLRLLYVTVPSCSPRAVADKGDNRRWMESFQRYLRDNELPSFFWALNPNRRPRAPLCPRMLSHTLSPRVAALARGDLSKPRMGPPQPLLSLSARHA